MNTRKHVRNPGSQFFITYFQTKLLLDYCELVSNCPGSFLIVLAVVFVVLVVVLVALEVVFQHR